MSEERLKETFDFNDPKSIIQSNIPISEKKVQLGILKIEEDDRLKKLKKDQEKKKKKPKFYSPSRSILYFVLLYLLTGYHVGLTVFIMLSYYFFHIVSFMLQGPIDKTKEEDVKKTEKKVKQIEQYIKVLKDS